MLYAIHILFSPVGLHINSWIQQNKGHCHSMAASGGSCLCGGPDRLGYVIVYFADRHTFATYSVIIL